jgi:hypothetical protein
MHPRLNPVECIWGYSKDHAITKFCACARVATWGAQFKWPSALTEMRGAAGTRSESPEVAWEAPSDDAPEPSVGEEWLSGGRLFLVVKVEAQKPCRKSVGGATIAVQAND